MNYISVSEQLPPKGERVLTLSDFGDGEYSWEPARLTNYGWRNDHSLPVRGVTHWTRVVSPDEKS